MSGINGNGKIISAFSAALACSRRNLREQARGEPLLTYLHSKAWTFSLAEGLMEQINRIVRPFLK
jgi:hypothetical protein